MEIWRYEKFLSTWKLKSLLYNNPFVARFFFSQNYIIICSKYRQFFIGCTNTFHTHCTFLKKKPRICIKIRSLLVKERRRTWVISTHLELENYQPSVLRSHVSFCIAANATGSPSLPTVVGSFAAGKTKRPVVNRFRFLDSFSWNFLPTVCFPLVFLARNELCF